jgi:hypothetical protein
MVQRADMVLAIIFIFKTIFVDIGFWTQGFTLARQMLYYLSHTSSYFEDSILLFFLGQPRLWFVRYCQIKTIPCVEKKDLLEPDGSTVTLGFWVQWLGWKWVVGFIGGAKQWGK